MGSGVLCVSMKEALILVAVLTLATITAALIAVTGSLLATVAPVSAALARALIFAGGITFVTLTAFVSSKA